MLLTSSFLNKPIISCCASLYYPELPSPVLLPRRPDISLMLAAVLSPVAENEGNKPYFWANVGI